MYFELAIDDPTHPDGYLEANRFWLGYHFERSVVASYKRPYLAGATQYTCQPADILRI